MFKPTSALQGVRRLPLTTKQAGKEYYKGNHVGKLGEIDRYGRFHPDYSRIRTFVYPERGLNNFPLTPFVARSVAKNIEGWGEDGKKQWALPKKTTTGKEYLEDWKTLGGHDEVASLAQNAQAGRKMNMPEVWEEPVRKGK